VAAPALGDRIRARVDRLIASPAFQRWAAAFPLTRPLARRRSRQLFDLVSGFVYTQVLLAALRLRAFEVLAEGPIDPAAAPARLGLPPDSARRLLDAMVVLELAERDAKGRYRLGALGAPLLGRPEIAAMVEHNTLLYDDLRDPVALLRDPRDERWALGRFWAYAKTDAPARVAADAAASYSALMSASQPLVAAEILDAYPFARHRSVLDVGGGDGTFIQAVAERVPGLALTLFDLPAVADRARSRLAAAGLGERVRVVGGSFRDDPLPEGHDLVTLVRVAHDHDDAVVESLFARIHAALAPGGTLLIAEPMAGLAGAERVGPVYFGLYLLAMGSGRARSPEELRGMLAAAGFRRTRALASRSPIQTGFVAATK
jgi:demethylspheroidene O-methyltransferase